MRKLETFNPSSVIHEMIRSVNCQKRQTFSKFTAFSSKQTIEQKLNLVNSQLFITQFLFWTLS